MAEHKIHFHSSDDRFCGCCETSRRFSTDANEITCEACQSNDGFELSADGAQYVVGLIGPHAPCASRLTSGVTWQPIETAPKNEEVIIALYDDRFVDPVIQNSLQVDREERGWQWTDWHGYPPPTHWMPIPPAPIKLDDPEPPAHQREAEPA